MITSWWFVEAMEGHFTDKTPKEAPKSLPSTLLAPLPVNESFTHHSNVYL